MPLGLINNRLIHLDIWGRVAEGSLTYDERCYFRGNQMCSRMRGTNHPIWHDQTLLMEYFFSQETEWSGPVSMDGMRKGSGVRRKQRGERS